MEEAILSQARGATRAALRRAQILDAAAHCFNRDGFHAASMASIAGEAGLSVGQIYRLFENKEAVIEEIVARNLDEWDQRVAEARRRHSALIDEMLEIARYHVDKTGEPARAALALEFLAEAARNPRIGAIVARIDAAMRAHLRDALVRHGAHHGADLDARIEMLVMLIDGWPTRGVRNPQLTKAAFLEALRPLIERLAQCGAATRS